MAEIVIFSDINASLGHSRYAGAYRIASELRENGFDVQVIDFFASFDLNTIISLLETHVDRSTLFVGFSATIWTKYKSDEELYQDYIRNDRSIPNIIIDGMTPVFPHPEEEVRLIFSTIHKKNSKTKIVVGGFKATNYETSDVDYWILGQGEKSIVALANYLKYGTELKALETEQGKIITDRMYPYSKFSQSKIVWHENDFLFPRENVPIEFARGCIYKCSFSAFNLNGKKFGDYTKLKRTFQEELITNYENFGLTEYMIVDDTLIDSRQKFEFLYETLSELPFNITFSAYSRLEPLLSNPEIIPLMRDIGLRSVEFGIESMNKKTGQYIGKLGDRNKIADGLNLLKSIWKDDVYMAAGYIIGLPFETKQSMRETFDWLYSNDNPLDGIQMTKFWMERPPFLPAELGDRYDLESAGFNLTPRGWVYENVSKIHNNPEYYGFTQGVTEPKWKNINMTQDEAMDLENEFYTNPNARQKHSASTFVLYNRMKNIGYAHHEIGKLYHDDNEFLKEAFRRRANLKQEYLNKLL